MLSQGHRLVGQRVCVIEGNTLPMIGYSVTPASVPPSGIFRALLLNRTVIQPFLSSHARSSNSYTLGFTWSRGIPWNSSDETDTIISIIPYGQQQGVDECMILLKAALYKGYLFVRLAHGKALNTGRRVTLSP